jgi:hypothetical protein
MFFPFFLLLHIFITSYAPSTDNIDISGHWEGTGTRDAGSGKRTVYDVELDIVQKGKTITGISYVHIEHDNKKYHAKMEVEGKINGTYIKYTETKLLSADVVPNASWCIKKVELIHRIQDGKPTLDGIWEGYTNDKKGECVPGRIFLQKKPPRV